MWWCTPVIPDWKTEAGGLFSTMLQIMYCPLLFFYYRHIGGESP